MRKLILSFTAVFLLFVACNKNCKIKYPKDVKPIDWENYNDVYTVYWNMVHCCSETIDLQNETIKISGWKAWSYDAFNLCGEAKYADRKLGYTAASPFITIECHLHEFKEKLDTCDLTKKCYIEGKIYLLEGENTGNGCKKRPIIKIMDINDIYFE